MPQTNLFRHQAYTDKRPTSPHCLLNPGPHPPVDSDEFRRRMQQVGKTLSEAGVAAVYLVHGTFVGNDALGVLDELARMFPRVSKSVRLVIKRIVERLTGEVGNYTGSFAQLFESTINQPDRPTIPVRLFNWSSENNHIGRADGAVRLLDELISQGFPPGRKVLLWGHSHAGNLFALMTNLLAGNEDGGNRDAVERFFQAAEIYYQWPVVGCVDIPVWGNLRRRLGSGPPPLTEVALDIVTFGTPLRYGWASGGYGRLLHFVNHRPHEGLPDYQAPFPPNLDDVMKAADGDYVQQLGIAGTNVMPSVLSWRSWIADTRLDGLLQPRSMRESILDRFQTGAIVPDDGTTLLVDYGPLEGNIAQHWAGHAVYTEKKWLLFHAEEVARRFYQE